MFFFKKTPCSSKDALQIHQMNQMLLKCTQSMQFGQIEQNPTYRISSKVQH